MHIVQLLVLCSWVKDVKNVPHSYSQHKCQENGFSHVQGNTESTAVSITLGTHSDDREGWGGIESAHTG